MRCVFDALKGVKEVGIDQILYRSGEVGSTLPLREEEPLNPSYAAAGGFRMELGCGLINQTTGAQDIYWSGAAGGGRVLRMSLLGRRE